MKTSIIFSTFAIASGALAQIQIILDVVNSINTATSGLDTAVKGYSGGDSSAIQSASKSLIDIVTAGIDKVKGSSQLVLNDALQLTPVVQGLSATVSTTIDDLIAKKSQIAAAGQGAATGSQLKAQLSGANDLAAAISSKVPSDVAPIASQLSSAISEAIQKGVTAYADAGGAPSPGGSSPPSSGGSSPPPAAGSPSSPGSPTSAPASGGATNKGAPSSAASGGSTPVTARTSAAATTSKPAVSTGAASNINVPFFGAGFAVAAALFV
jgi:hypothetical protein